MDYYSKEEVDTKIAQAKQEVAEQILRALPGIMQFLVASVGSLKEMKEKFYQENKDLAEHKLLVAKVMEELEAKNPGVAFPSLLDKVATEARRRVTQLDTFDTSNPNKPTKSDLNAGLQNILGAFDEGK